jgi:HlyD family secretion protein
MGLTGINIGTAPLRHSPIRHHASEAGVTSDPHTSGTQISPETAALSNLLAGTGKRKSRWGLRLLILAALLGAGYGAWVFASKSTTYSYTTSAVKTGDLTVLVTATGSVEPTVQVDVSSEQSGTIREVLADFNSEVKKGDVLARLDTEKLTAELKSKEAALAAARANVAKAKADELSAEATVKRQTTLVGSRVSTQQDLDSAGFSLQAAQATRESAEANVTAAEADLEQAMLSLRKATIVSPIDGIVLSRDVDSGATVAASLEAPTLFKLAGDLREMELQVSIDEADVGQIAVGQDATFTVDAFPDQRFPAEITDVRYASETVNDVVTYKGILSVRNDELLLRQGMTATADIVVKAIKDALLIPNAALRYTPS